MGVAIARGSIKYRTSKYICLKPYVEMSKIGYDYLSDKMARKIRILE
jgi:hypothetical protein